MYYSKQALKIRVSSAVLKILIVALALILFGSVLQAFAADTVNDRAPHEFLELCYVNSCLFAERIIISTERIIRFNKATRLSRRDIADCLEHRH